MALITLNSYSIPADNLAEGNGYVVRYFYNYGFIDSDGQAVQSGSATTGTQIRVSASVAAGFLTIDNSPVYTTVDAQSPFPQSIFLSCQVFKGNTALPIYPFAQQGTPSQWVVYNNGDPTIDFDSLTFLNQTSTLAYPPQTYPTTQEMIDYINSIIPDLNTGFVMRSTYASLAAAVGAIGSEAATLLIEDLSPVMSNLTIPENVTLFFTNDGGIQPATGVTVTIQGPITAPPVQIFHNATAGLGTIAFSNGPVSEFYPEWWGGLGDGATDCTTAIQAILDACTAVPRSGTVKFQAGDYVVAGALQDTSASNAQIVLPKINPSTDQQITMAFIGPDAAPNPWSTEGGAIIHSSLASGTGAVIGVKCDWGHGSSTANIKAHNIASYMSVVFENITLRQVINPTNSGLDISRVYNVVLRNFRVDTDDWAVGGLNPNLIAGVPDVRCTEPTTATSYAIKLPMTFIPSDVELDHLTVFGYYNSILIGELVHGKSITIGGSKVGLAIEGAVWPCHLNDVVVVSTTRPVKSIGEAPDLAGLSGVVSTAQVFIDQLKVEHDPLMSWALTVYDIDDSSNYLSGQVRAWINAGGTLLINPAVPALLKVYRLERPWNYPDLMTDITSGGQLTASSSSIALFEIKRGATTSTAAKSAWLSLVTQQTSTDPTMGFIGLITFSNDEIADGLNKRLAQMYVTTDGATNSGKLWFDTMNAGTLTPRVAIDHLGNFIVTGLIEQTEGGTLTISSNTIAPTASTHVVGAGLIKTITLPPGISVFATVVVDLIPSAAFTWDNTGNIASSGTAVIGRTLTVKWIPSQAKWAVSYN